VLVSTICLAASATMALASMRAGRRPRRSFRVAVRTMSTADPWESDPEHWRPVEPEPGETHSDGWHPLPVRGLRRLGIRLDCPKCRATNDLRQAAGLSPLPQRFSVRTRDRALWCWIHDQYFRPESQDSIIRRPPDREP